MEPTCSDSATSFNVGTEDQIQALTPHVYAKALYQLTSSQTSKMGTSGKDARSEGLCYNTGVVRRQRRACLKQSRTTWVEEIVRAIGNAAAASCM